MPFLKNHTGEIREDGAVDPGLEEKFGALPVINRDGRSRGVPWRRSEREKRPTVMVKK